MIDGGAHEFHSRAPRRQKRSSWLALSTNVATGEFAPAESGGGGRPRRAFVVADTHVAASLERQLAHAGYATKMNGSGGNIIREIADFAPGVILVETHSADGERIALARRLRAEAQTHALPLVFLHHGDERTLRSAALNVGADDYFALATPQAEMCARLDALFWRAEAGRRAAPVVGEQNAEIDNFLLLLDAVRADIEAGAAGVLSVVEASQSSRAGVVPSPSPDPKQERKIRNEAARRTLAEVHGFLKLNLRRVDTVAFYGPTTLLVYLPRTKIETALASLSNLRADFLSAGRASAGNDFAVGLAAFPSDGVEVETLIEKAEAAARAAQEAGHDASRVVAFNAPAPPRISAPAPTAVAVAPVAQPDPQPREEDATPEGAAIEDGADVEADSEIVEPEGEAVATTPAQPSPQEASVADAPVAEAPVVATETRAAHETTVGGGETNTTNTETNAEGEREDGETEATSPAVPPVVPSIAPPAASVVAEHAPPRVFDTQVVRESRASEHYAPASSSVVTSGARAANKVDALARDASEAGARELARRARGEAMPRRLLLAVSDPARMAQLNLLIRSAGYEVRAAFDGQQALNLLRIERPDVLVLDYELKDMDGLETLRRLRKQSGGRMPLASLLLVRAGVAGEADLRGEALEAGARGVVVLPYQPSDLLDAVRAAGATE